MKQLKLLFVGLLLVAANGLFAQITFTEGTFEEALAKAKAEKKNLFIDFYANWCGPCKVMAAQVFTIPPVGDYFNEHFINCKLDCDAAANKEVVKRYKVESLPTLMFLDSKGEVLRTLVGAVTPDVLMLEAQIATGEELPFEKLYEKSRKEKKNTELQQKLLIRAPHFIGTQNGYNQEKWKVRIDALFPEYLKTKKLENMINPTDGKTRRDIRFRGQKLRPLRRSGRQGNGAKLPYRTLQHVYPAALQYRQDRLQAGPRTHRR